MTTLTQQYREAQEAYQKTLGPWIEARSFRDGAAEVLRNTPVPTKGSRTQFNRGTSKRDLARAALKKAETQWKAAKKVRYEALQEVWRSEWHLKDSRAAWDLILTIPAAREAALREILEDGGTYRAVIHPTEGAPVEGTSKDGRLAAVKVLQGILDIPPQPKKARARG